MFSAECLLADLSAEARRPTRRPPRVGGYVRLAFRVEWLGIGLWGSREARPKCKASELGPVLIDVVLGPRAGEMRSKARELASVCEAYGEGRDIAAKQVLGFLTH